MQRCIRVGDVVIGYPIAGWPHAPREMRVVAIPWDRELALCEWDEKGGFGVCRTVVPVKSLTFIREQP